MLFDDGTTVVECEVRDLSTIGARLKAREPQNWPKALTLEMNDGAVYACEVMWSLNTLVGVKFGEKKDQKKGQE
jgi:hypothetical protein